jgi:hypothetical protein
MIRHRRISRWFVGYMIALLTLLIAAMICLMTRPAWPAASASISLPSGVTCEMIREKVAEHGYLRSVYWARSQGYSWAQINQAKKCLRG